MSQKAAVFTEKGKSFEVKTIEKHKPEKGEILIKIYTIATNPSDKFVQENGLFVETFPCVIGTDAAGTVEEVGEGVTRFKKGDKVLGLIFPYTIRRGAFQEYSIVQEDYAGLMPDNCNFEKGVTLILPTVTAASCLYVDLALPRPKSVSRPQLSNDMDVFYVNSGATAVGAAAIQLLAIQGYRVIATSSPKNFDLIKSFGASEVFDYNDADLVQKVKTVARKPFNLAMDARPTPASLIQCIDILDGKGTLSILAPAPIDLNKRNVNVIFAYSNAKFIEDRESGPWFWNFVKSATEAGTFVGLAPEILGTKIEDIQKVVDYHSSGKVSASKPVIKLI